MFLCFDTIHKRDRHPDAQTTGDGKSRVICSIAQKNFVWRRLMGVYNI